ncbi:MAG: response regulator transcription factor [Bacteroidaceae bacterium]|nr:response regulator transcription factor [Bacteroidaceae bacterium]MBR1755891.1 response regulator transcription factor [Bacteroidaceae bacterium]MBR1791863.1 response regulator transcription factor [Bacteroidaceae bacterium]
MSDLIHDDYRLLQVISRFGVSLGFGDQSVDAACKASGVDTMTFLTVVNFIQSEGRLSVSELAKQVSVAELMRYLRRSHTYFVDFRLPAIRRKLIEAINCSAKNQLAFLILKFYDEYAAAVQRHMDYENEHIHSYVQQLLDGHLPQRGSTYRALAAKHHDNHSSISYSSHELKSIIIKYYPSDSDTQRLADTLMDIYIMEEDLFSHCHLEDTLFAEAVHLLELEVSARAEDGSQPMDERPKGKAADAANSDELSEREKEVVRMVVRGLSNKEIAEKMFISANTVMTHRRNIARKTQIHSPAGLTIYAIVNGLINLEEVKL